MPESSASTSDDIRSPADPSAPEPPAPEPPAQTPGPAAPPFGTPAPAFGFDDVRHPTRPTMHDAPNRWSESRPPWARSPWAQSSWGKPSWRERVAAWSSPPGSPWFGPSRTPQVGPFAPLRGFGVFVPAILGMLWLIPTVPAFVHRGLWIFYDGQRMFDLGPVLTLVVGIAGVLTLLPLKRFPGPTVLVEALLAAVYLVSDPWLPVYPPLLIAIVGACVWGAVRWAVVAVGAVWFVALMLIAGERWHASTTAVVLFTVLLVLSLVLGVVIRERQQQRAAMSHRMAQHHQSVAEQERVRIARELHDVLGHSLSQISVQAGVGLHLIDRDLEETRLALERIRSSSKSALDEVRQVLGVLRAPSDPTVTFAPEPGLADITSLADGVRDAGIEVYVSIVLESLVPSRAVQLAAFRIVQEALTNVLRHSGATEAWVRLVRGSDPGRNDLVLTVADNGRGMQATASVLGSGVLGMRERAILLGGSLTVGPRQEGGTVIHAWLPLGMEATTETMP